MNNKLIIGTANFGMNYGISVNQKKLLDKDIIDILVLAEKIGIETLDTAISYGDSIERLGNVGVQKFKIICKIPRIPFDIKNPSDRYRLSVTNLIKKLNKNNLEAILLHYPKDLFINKNHKLIQTLLDFKKNKIVNKIGVSIYEKKELEEILKIFKPDIIQCPINIFDNRLTKNNFLKRVSDKSIEIHARSIFLQGLLLQDGNKIPEEFSKFEKLFKKWENWLKLNNLNSLEACIMYTNFISEVTKIVVGINSAVQLKEIIKYKNKNIPVNFGLFNTEFT